MIIFDHIVSKESYVEKEADDKRKRGRLISDDDDDEDYRPIKKESKCKRTCKTRKMIKKKSKKSFHMIEEDVEEKKRLERKLIINEKEAV